LKYTIISVGDTRAANKARIRDTIKSVPEVTDIEFCNAVDYNSLSKAMDRFPNIKPNGWGPQLGELGIWLSQASCWQYAVDNNTPLIALEDDALVQDNFDRVLPEYLSETPDDWDFISLCVPGNQLGDISYKVVYDDTGAPKTSWRAGDKPYQFRFGSRIMARAYQGYCCVATLYSPKGAARLLEIANEKGVYTPVDCFLFLEAHGKNQVKAYAPTPDAERIVDIDWEVPTTIHHTARYGE
jgi:GR25 family glycosyltransferase involved in LPS biosynthesis